MNDWVFLRGLTRESAHWGDFPQRFRGALPEARVHLVDLPGSGTRCHVRSPASVAAMVVDLRAQLRERRVVAPVKLLALSLGAMVATQWIAAAPDDVACAVLVNTSMRPFSPLHHRLRPQNLPALLRLALTRPDAETAERIVWQLTSRQEPVGATVLAAWAQARRDRPVRAADAFRQLLAAARFRAPLQAPERPVLLLASERDRLVNSQCSRVLARAWGCPLVWHPDAGHDLPLDDPTWVVEQIRAWRCGAPGLSSS